MVLSIKRVSRNKEDDSTLNWMYSRLVDENASLNYINKLEGLIDNFKGRVMETYHQKILSKCEKEVMRMKEN